MRSRSMSKKWIKEIKQNFNKELKKLQRMNPAMADYSVQRAYLELVLDLPWGEYTNDNFDLKKAQKYWIKTTLASIKLKREY